MPAVPFPNPSCGNQNCLQRLSDVPTGAKSPLLKTALLHHSYPLTYFAVVSPPSSHTFPNFHISLYYCLTSWHLFAAFLEKELWNICFLQMSLPVQFPVLNSMRLQSSGFPLPLWLLHFGLLYQLYLVGQRHNLYFVFSYFYQISSCLSCLISLYSVSPIPINS